MKTLYVRINPRTALESFWRCGIQFSQAWQPVRDLDDATAQRLEEEQMLEVTDTRPAELDDAAQAGDSANAVILGAAGGSVPPVVALGAAEAAAAEAAAAEAAAAEAAAAEAKTKKKAK